MSYTLDRNEMMEIITIGISRVKKNHYYHYDELLSWAYFGYADALRTYDPNKTSSFRNWAVDKVRWRIIHEMRSETGYRKKNRDQYKSVPLIQEYDDGEADRAIWCERSDPDFESVEDSLIVEQALNVLRPREKEIFDYTSEGYTLAEIAEAWGVTEGRICQLRTAGYKRMKDELGEI